MASGDNPMLCETRHKRIDGGEDGEGGGGGVDWWWRPY